LCFYVAFITQKCFVFVTVKKTNNPQLKEFMPKGSGIKMFKNQIYSSKLLSTYLSLNASLDRMFLRSEQINR